MLANRSKLFTAGCLLLGLLVCVAGIVTVSRYKKTTECFKDRPPLRGFVLTVNRSQQKLLIEQSRKFADKHGFKFDIAYYTPQGDDFLIDLTRKDVEATISNPSFDLGKFDVDFYNYDCIHPTVAADIGGLFNDLKSLVNEIPNVTITEKIKGLTITIDTNRDQEVYNQLIKLAHKHSLKFTLSFSSDKSVFDLEIFGDGFRIIGGNRFHTKGVDDIDISFYTDINNKIPNPTPIPQKTTDELFNDLKSNLGEIPNVTMTEMK